MKIKIKKNAIAKICLLLFVYYKILPWIFKKESPLQKEAKTFIINLPGCYIPNYMKNLRHIEPQHKGMTCGQRLLHLEHVSDQEVRVIGDVRMPYPVGSSNYSHLKCGFVKIKSLDSSLKGILSRIQPVRDGQIIRITDEASIFVICSPIDPLKIKFVKADLPQPVHTDYYVVLKKKTVMNKKPVNEKGSSKKWNVLLLGMESMTRARVMKSMPELVDYFEKEGWLDYRALQKVSKNNNILSLLAGNKILNKQCSNLYICRDLFLFHKYRQSGYVTALGKDGTVTRNSLIAKISSFNLTDHYLNILTSIQSGNFDCYGQVSTGEQMLDYALQFARSYEKENFFGKFLSSSFSHVGSKGIPALFQNSLINFFRQLNSKSILQHTFILFFGDGDSIQGFSKEVFYDIRLPALYLWVPLQFRRLHREEYNNLILNQNRLITYNDLHIFLEQILEIADHNAGHYEPHSENGDLLEEISPERTCNDANVEEASCACYNVTNADDEGSKQSLFVTLTEIAQRLSSANFRHPYTVCRDLNFKEVLRSHSYRSEDKTYYITAGIFDFGDVVFESLVERLGEKYRLISVNSLTEYKTKSGCIRADDPAKEFCVCEFMYREPNLPYNITRKNP